MPRSFNLPPFLAQLPAHVSVRDPRLVMRVAMGVLLAANLAAAVMAFHPFGGGADDLRRQQEQLTARIAQMQSRLKASRDLVAKVQVARNQGGEFMDKYFMTTGQMQAQILDELQKSALAAGVKVGQESFSQEEIEGTNSLHMLTTQVGLEGTYANLAKFVNLLDKSPRFLIIESMTAAAPQQQQQGPKGPPPEQNLNVTVKVDCFVKDLPGAES